MQTTSKTVYTFSAGPGVLPKEVLKKAQEEMLDWHGCGISVLEMSHRSKQYDSIIKKAEQDLRELVNIPQNYKVIFMQGGGSMQFSCIPMNLLRGKKTANYLVTGYWGETAIEEARKYCKPHEVLKVVPGAKMTSIPDPKEWSIDPEGAYFYYVDNETITGLEFPYVPEVQGQILVCDMSSNFCSKPIDVTKYGLIFAGAQKNIGPAGTTVVIVREDLLDNKMDFTPIMCDYAVLAEKQSMYNTPPCYTIYLCGLIFEYLKKMGGLKYWQEFNIKKANMIYDCIENSNGFYIAPVQKGFRSIMNIPFTIKNNEDLSKKFAVEAAAEGLIELKGHRILGNCRASIYNGMPMEGIEKLVAFMAKFMENNK